MSVISELRQAGAKGTPSARPKDGRAALVFLAPWLIGLFGITLGPMVASLYLSFTNYNLLQAPTFTGFANITAMFSDQRLWHSLGTTFLYMIVSVPIQLALALGLAMLLEKSTRGSRIYGAILYLPSLLGSSVAIAVLWKLIFGTDGLINAFLGLFGIEGQGWISSPDTSLGTLILLHVWTFGAPMVIFLAGLRQVPREYYEASATDGATRFRQFRSITLPLLSPIIFFNLVLGVIGAFQSFTQAFVVSGGSGGPSDSTLFFTLYLYQQGFSSFHMGYASAIAWLLLVIVGALTGINFWASKFWVHYDD